MSNDFRKDPEYKHIRRGMLGSTLKGIAWGVAAVALAWTALFFLGTIGAPFAVSGAITSFVTTGGVWPAVVAGAAGIGALFSAFKGWQSKIDKKAAFGEVTAERTAVRLGGMEGHEQGHAQAKTHWQENETVRRSQRSSGEVSPS